MMGSFAGSEHGGLSMEKAYNCKICGKAFSSRRVLGGHVRSHQATAGLAARSMKSPLFAEKSEGDSCLTDRASNGVGYRNSGKSPRNSTESFGTRGRKIGSWSCENRCGLCKKGFGSRKALFGHMRVHSRSKQCGKGESDRHVPSPVVQVSSVEVMISSRKSSVEEALSECEIVSPTMRRKRSVRVSYSGNEPVNNASRDFGIPLSTLLSGDNSEEEIEAATALLMISTGGGTWKYSDDEKNSSGFLQNGTEDRVCDDLLLGVGNKRRRLSEVDEASPKVLKVPGNTDSFSIDSNVKGKAIEYQFSCDMISGGLEVRSFGAGSKVEDMRSLVVDVLEGEKIPGLSLDDELGGGNRVRMIPDSDCRKSVLTFERRGYKCKSCGRILPTQLELGDHHVMSCSSLVDPVKTEDKERNGEGNCSLSHANDGAVGQSSGSHIWSDDNKESAAVASEKNCQGALLPDLNVPVEFFEEENSIGSAELLGLTLSNIRSILL